MNVYFTTEVKRQTSGKFNVATVVAYSKHDAAEIVNKVLIKNGFPHAAIGAEHLRIINDRRKSVTLLYV